MTHKLIRIKNVIEMTGKSRSAIYADMVNGTFPRPIAIGTRSVAWQLSEVDKWIEDRILNSAT